MSELDDVRQQYPEYSSWSDQKLGRALKKKYHPDMPEQEYWSQLGVDPNQQPDENMQQNAGSAQPQQQQQPEQPPQNDSFLGRLANKLRDAERLSKVNLLSKPSEVQEFLAASGVRGANRGFSKVFGAGKHREDSQTEYEKALETHPIATSFGNAAAQTYSAAPFGMAAGGGILGTGAGAGAMGLYEHPEEGETRLGNAGKNAALAVGGMGLAKGAQAIPGVASSISKGATKTRVAESINKAFVEKKDKYSKLYGNLFKEADKAKIKVELPKFHGLTESAQKNAVKTATEGINPKTVRAVKKAIASGKPKDVNKAQSKLGQYLREQTRKVKKGGSIDDIAYDKAEKLQKSLNKSLDQAFAKSNPKLAKDYNKIKTGYKKEVIPYSRNAAIQDYNAGELAAEDLVHALRGRNNSGKAFRKHLIDKHPEFKTNQLIGRAGKAIGGAGALEALHQYLK